MRLRVLAKGTLLKTSLVQALVERGALSSEQADSLHGRMNGSGIPVESVLLESGLIESQTLINYLAERLRLPIVSLKDRQPGEEVLRLVPAEIVQRHQCLPLERDGLWLTVATATPSSLEMLDEVRFATGLAVRIVLAYPQELLAAIEEHYDVTIEKMLKDLTREDEEASGPEEYFIHDLQEKASEPTLINLVNLIISEAIEEGASDIHVEPYERDMRVKYRIDGILQEVSPPPKSMQPAIVSRIKIMAGMDIAKRHIPQDGYIRINLARGQVDIRVATVPTIFGEGVVMRLLNKSAILIQLEDLGLSKHTMEQFEPLLKGNFGIQLVCGPTGSGKTTTLYAVLNKIQTPEKKIITIEDPVEYQLDGINQIPVRPGRGVTFATGLRSILRLDPDILLVGEIRDIETAEIAIRSALTGHLIFSTLHTNDAASAVTRLLDMGIEPYLIASSLQGVLAQRLVRRLCPECREPFTPNEDLLAQFDQAPEEASNGTFFEPRGCDACKHRGYLGRIGIFELLVITEKLQHLILRSQSSHAIKAAAIESMSTMRDDGWQKIRAGVTTFAEVFRQTQRDQAAELDIWNGVED